MDNKGFISAPSLKQLEPTPEEKAKLRELWEWQRQSAKFNYIFGPSKHCFCGAQNNPNNQRCYVCGRPFPVDNLKI